MRHVHSIIKRIPDYWHLTLLGVFTLICVSVALYYHSWVSIVKIWIRSDTFAHGFLIVPISLWLIWTKRKHFQVLRPQPSWAVLWIIFAFGLIWLLADLTQVQVIRQYATVALMVSALWMLLGHQVTLQLMMPLGFLFLMVPIGEDLIPPLMSYTANFTVWMLRLTGLSVYREGMHFTLTSGNWSVVEGCSGLRYLIASITLGFVYAYLNYSRFWKRAFFVLLSIVVPIIANGFRAYMIVMIAHFSDMKLALGVDHYIYGGVFFGIVMMLLFFLGSFWRDPPQEVTMDLSGNTTDSGNGQWNARRLMSLVLMITVSFAVWPVTSYWLKNQQLDRADIHQNFSTLYEQGWKQTDDPIWRWKAEFKEATDQSYHYFSDGKKIIGVYQAGFGDELQGGGELVNSQNIIVRQKHPYWRMIDNGQTLVNVGPGPVEVDEFILRSKDRNLLLFRWYQIGNKVTANKYMAKIYQLLKLLTADSSPEIQVIIFTKIQDNKLKEARAAMKRIAEVWIKQGIG